MERRQGNEAAREHADPGPATGQPTTPDQDRSELSVAAGAIDPGRDPEPDIRVRDRQHLEAAIRMVVSGASRWVIVSGVGDARDLLETGNARGRGISVTALSSTAILVARPETLPELAASIRPREAQGWLARAGHLLSSILR